MADNAAVADQNADLGAQAGFTAGVSANNIVCYRILTLNNAAQIYPGTISTNHVTRDQVIGRTVRMDAVTGMSPRFQAIQGNADVVARNDVMGCFPQPDSKITIAADQVTLAQGCAAGLPVAADDVEARIPCHGDTHSREANDLHTTHGVAVR